MNLKLTVFTEEAPLTDFVSQGATAFTLVIAGSASGIRGTNPNKWDTDGDGLSDGVETNTRVYVSRSDTGTNPLSSDTDADGVNDKREIDLGTDPNASPAPAEIQKLWEETNLAALGMARSENKPPHRTNRFLEWNGAQVSLTALTNSTPRPKRFSE